MSRVLLDTSALLYWTLRPEVLDVPVVTSDAVMRQYTGRAVWA